MFESETIEGARERAAVLALLARRYLPWNRLAGVIEEQGSALAVLREVDAEDRRLFQVDDRRLTLDQLEEQVHSWEEEGMRLVTVLDPDYPENLRMVHDRPPLLFVRGQLEERDERSVAVVGTRRATQSGLDAAAQTTRDLVEAEYVIVSGLAAGIDTAAHTAALDTGGRTIAVVGTGLRHAYPPQNAALQDQLGRETAVISQFWPGQEPRKWTFPQRNAVMSGFARATVVVEASGNSGARMQARLAIEHGRPVFLLNSLLRYPWARMYADERPNTYVVKSGAEIVGHLDRLYTGELVELIP